MLLAPDCQWWGVGLWTQVSPTLSTQGCQRPKANFPFHQPCLFIGFTAMRSQIPLKVIVTHSSQWSSKDGPRMSRAPRNPFCCPWGQPSFIHLSLRGWMFYTQFNYIKSVWFFFFKCLGQVVWHLWSQVLDQGWNPCSLHWNHRFSTTGPPEKSQQQVWTHNLRGEPRCLLIHQV